MKNYKVLKDGARYTIGQYDEGYKAYITNDGICQYYWWDTEEDAQAAADAYNAYEGCEWIGERGRGNDIVYEQDSTDEGMIALYRFFNAVKQGSEFNV